jgi:hypothetical protein
MKNGSVNGGIWSHNPGLGAHNQNRVRNRESNIMSTDNIATKKILSPRFAGVTPDLMEAQRKSMPRVDIARKSMPIDKFSVFNKRKGKSGAEIMKEQQRGLKQSRKEEA